MKKHIPLSIIFLVCFLGCSVYGDYVLDVPEFATREEVGEWIYANIKYQTDWNSEGQAEYWRHPMHTLQDRVGDCEDVSILFAAICYDQFGEELVLRAGKFREGNGHCWVAEKSGEPVFYHVEGYDRILWEMTLEQALRMCR